MEHFFSTDSKLFHLLGRVADLILLNFLFLITSIPVVTIGASCTALYSVTMHMADNTESYITRSYFLAWKNNFKTSTVVWSAALLLLILCKANLSILPALPSGPLAMLLLCFQLLFLFILCGILLYLFCLLSAFENTLRNTVRNATILTFRFLPYTILCMCISAVLPALIVLFPQAAGILLSVMIAVGFSLTAYFHSVILLKIFRRVG